MKTTTEIAKLFRYIHFGGNWTEANLKDLLADVTWQEATQKVYDLNTIAALVFHINYFVEVVLRVLQGGPLKGSDKESFDHPPIESQADWEGLVTKSLREAEQVADLLETFPDEKLFDTFFDEKYHNYYYNFHGIIEHNHYHIGQIVLLKKIIRAQQNTG